MPAPAYKFSQFADLLLVRLYELDQEQGDNYYDLNAVVQEIQGPVPPSWVFDAAKVLQSRGLADCIFTFGGTSARITGEGRLYVEEERGFTKDAQHDRTHYFINASGGNVNIATGNIGGQISQSVTVQQETAPIFQVLDEIKQQLNGDTSLPAPERAELLTYVDVLRQQAKKTEPNRSVIAAVLEPMSKVTAIGANVATLIRYFNSSL